MIDNDKVPGEAEHSFDIMQDLDRGLDDEPAGGSKLPRKRTAFPGHSRDALASIADADEADLFSTALMDREVPAASDQPQAAAPMEGADKTEAMLDAEDQRTALLSLDEDVDGTALPTKRFSLADSTELPPIDGAADTDETSFAPYTFAEDDADEVEANANTWINYGFDGDGGEDESDKRKRMALVAAVAAVVVVAIAVAVWFFFLRAPEPMPEPVKKEPVEQEEEVPTSLTASLTVDAPEWVADYGTFNFSVTDAAGAEVAALQVTPGTPAQLELAAGTYTVTATQIPSLADGRTYAYQPKHTIEVTEDMLKEGASPSDAWTFTILDPNDQAAVDAAVAALPAEEQEAARAFYDGRKTVQPEEEQPAETSVETDDTATDTDTSSTPNYNYTYTPPAYTPPANNYNPPATGGDTGNSGGGDVNTGGDAGNTGGDVGGGDTTGGDSGTTGGDNPSDGTGGSETNPGGGSEGGNTGDGGSDSGTSTEDPMGGSTVAIS